MTNTESIYVAMKAYQSARSAARDEFLRTLQQLERAKGSALYTEAREKAEKKRAASIEAAQTECRYSVNRALDAMRRAIRSRKMQPPTEEQLRILQLLKMRASVTRPELDVAANAMDGNGSALALLNEIARANERKALDAAGNERTAEFFPNYAAMATDGLPAGDAEKLINEIANACAGRINDTVGANRAAARAAAYYNRQHGGSYDPDALPQEEPYAGEQDFFGGITSVPFDTVAKTLNE